jgi:hypothetical protein
MGGSGAEQQAQYHPWGVSSAILFTNNAFGSYAADVPHPQARTLAGISQGRIAPVVVECRMPNAKLSASLSQRTSNLENLAVGGRF